MVIHLVMPSLYTALDGDTPGDTISLISSFRWWYTWWWWAARSGCGQSSASPCPHYARCQGRACKVDLIRYKVLLAASVVVCSWKGHTPHQIQTLLRHLVFRYFLSNDTIPCHSHRTSLSSSMFRRAETNMIMKTTLWFFLEQTFVLILDK